VVTIVTLELPFISDFMVEQMEEHIYSCLQAGADALIVGDIGLIALVRELGLDVPLHSSTFLGPMNWEAVDYIRKLGIARVVLERHVRLDEIREIVARARDVEVEAFAFGGGCSNLNANCYLTGKIVFTAPEVDKEKVEEEFRGNYKPCHFPFDVYDLGSGRHLGRAPIIDAYTYCAICDFAELVQTGIDGLKVVDRCRPVEYQVAATRIVRELRDVVLGGEGAAFDHAQRAEFACLAESFKDTLLQMTHPPAGQPASPPVRLRDLACGAHRCYFESFFHRPYTIA
jgi:putative protease